MKNKTIIIIAVLQFFAVSFVVADSINYVNFWDLSSLEGWKQGLAKSETLPYINEGIGSKFIWGALSPSGSYIFVTITDNSLERSAYDSYALDAMITENSFVQFNFIDFKKEIETIQTTIGNDSIDFDLLIMSVTALGSGYDFVSGNSVLTLVKKAYLPIVLKTKKDYLNYIIVMNYRGKADNQKDIAIFHKFYKSFSVSDEYSIVDIQRFNMIQPELIDMLNVSSPIEKSSPVIDVYDPQKTKDNKTLEKELFELNAKAYKIMQLLIKE